MSHLPQMIIDLALILGAAAVSTLIFSKLRQPVVLGYLVAGFFVGPYFSLWPTVADTKGVQLWAEIGVIFLLFGLGLEFSFKKLAKVGKSAFIAASFEIITMSALGYLVGRALGWNTMDSIYLGAILSMSSTTIIIRAFDEAKLKGAAFASLVFGILIVEDLMAILLMVILSAISIPGSFSAANLAFLSGRLAFFLLAWFIVGIYVLPSVLRRVRRLLSNEIMLIVSIALCLMMVVLATKANFSAAIGAFIMGSILAETEEGERIEHLMASVKDLFAAVFFVSVGMMIDPTILREHFWVVIIITILTIVGKLFGSGFGAVLSGRSLKQSTQAGMSLAQIGEFSFIIATLGVSLKVVSDFLYPIVIAVSAVTTFTTPYMIRYSGTIYEKIESRLPQKFLDRLNQYEQAMSSKGTESAVGLLWRSYGMLILLNSVIVLAIGLSSAELLLPVLISAFGDGTVLRLSLAILTLVVCSPFLLAIVLKEPKKMANETAATLLRLRRLQFGLVLFRSIFGLVMVEIIISQFARARVLPLAVLAATPILIFVFKKYIGRFYSAVERRFLQNLNAKEIAELEKLEKLPQLAPWNAALTQLVLSSDSPIAGQTLEECKFRSTTGATVAMIDRGKRRIFAPSRSERLLPNDEMFLIGTEDQLATVRKLIQPVEAKPIMPHDELYSLDSVVIAEDSAFARKSIRDLGIGEEFGGLVVGIERENERILNPESLTILEPGDVIWVFGHQGRIRDLRNAARK
ncbi:MAG TPA: cation:proton antiporter [Bdellovibrionales bacterium]|nr:cation:proton antiporter [Bdellovibrionales bacterium]